MSNLLQVRCWEVARNGVNVATVPKASITHDHPVSYFSFSYHLIVHSCLLTIYVCVCMYVFIFMNYYSGTCARLIW